jgi:hypothetical protein
MLHDEEQKPRYALPSLSIPPLPQSVRSHGILAALAVALAVVLIYGVHERGVAAHVSAQSVDTAAQLKAARAQIGVLTARLDSIAASQPPAGQLIATPSANTSRPVAVAVRPPSRKQKPDPRWKRVQDQLDAQGKAIESTRQELAGTRSDLQDSIARTHDDLVVLQKRGERNYVEFDLDKSKNFHSAGPVAISVRKADTKHQFADLKLLVDDRELSKKHLNLYEPVVFYPSDERQPVELVINSITKNHIRGYISSAKYKASELAAGATLNDRQKLAGPR